MDTTPTQKTQTEPKKRHRLRTALVIIITLFVLGFAGVAAYIQYITPRTVAEIHGRKVTMDMVMGKDLPPEPSDWVDVYADGYDENENGIRDDVELEIHRRHPDSARIRAAQLQYAMAMQSRMTSVYNKQMYVATIQEIGRGWGCIQEVFPQSDEGLPNDRPVHEWTEEEMELGNQHSKDHAKLVDPLEEEVEALMLNTEGRREQYYSKIKFATSHGLLDDQPDCDIDLNTLPN